MADKIGPVNQSMIGKINGNIDETGVTKRVSADKSATSTGTERPESSSDTVNLTSGAQLLERLEKSLQSLPAVDNQRVSEVRQAIENGDYEIDSKAIAEAMIRLDTFLSE